MGNILDIGVSSNILQDILHKFTFLYVILKGTLLRISQNQVIEGKLTVLLPGRENSHQSDFQSLASTRRS